MTEHAIVVGIDGSESSKAALHWALVEGERNSEPVHVISTWSYPWMVAAPAPIGTAGPPPEEMEVAAEAGLTALVETLSSGSGVEITHEVLQGDAAGALIEASEDASLLVVGSRGRGAFKRAMLGSVSSKVVAHSECPVLVVPEGSTPDDSERVIVVGVDGSPNSAAALAWAIGRSSPERDEVRAVSVVHNPARRDVERAIELVDHEVQTAAEALAPVVDPAGDLADARGVKFGMEIVAGDAREVLFERGMAADLVVVGVRGEGGISSMVMGSVATYLVHHLPGAIAVVPHVEAD
jgi:nucleotide-binding universal stress UspA family protein